MPLSLKNIVESLKEMPDVGFQPSILTDAYNLSVR